MELTLTDFPLDEALRYIGCPPGGADPATRALAEDCAQRLLAAARPRWLYKVFSILPANGGVALDCGLCLPGVDLARHLADCDRVALLCATLSAPVDQLIRVTTSVNLAEALVLDACATAAVETLCDRAEALIRDKFPGCGFPTRFSPGYGDLPLALQPALLSLLDAPRQIGLAATASFILTPRKSVTAILGISRKPIDQPTGGCGTCNLHGRCQFQCRFLERKLGKELS